MCAVLVIYIRDRERNDLLVRFVKKVCISPLFPWMEKRSKILQFQVDHVTIPCLCVVYLTQENNQCPSSLPKAKEEGNVSSFNKQH